jgi:hypothetical protein
MLIICLGVCPDSLFWFQPDTYVQRGLTYEGLADWESAVKDYSKALLLWGGGRGPDTNPYALTYRGNALSFLGRSVSKLIVNMCLAATVSVCRDEWYSIVVYE